MTQQKYEYNTIEEALEELRAGHMIIVSDDPDRENEGDLICAAQFCTTENMNFMASHGKGLICMPVSREYARKLNLPPMVAQNTTTEATTSSSAARYGRVSRSAILEQLPEMKHARTQLDSLRAKYEREARYNEESFRRQFFEYLQEQRHLPCHCSGCH